MNSRDEVNEPPDASVTPEPFDPAIVPDGYHVCADLRGAFANLRALWAEVEPVADLTPDPPVPDLADLPMMEMVTRAEFSAALADIASLNRGALEDVMNINRTLRMVMALTDRVAALEERTRPLGSVAEPVGIHKEALAERKAVVEWLRKQADGHPSDLQGGAFADAATNIEDGEHRKVSR